MNTRIYKVWDLVTGDTRLIDASSAAQAVRHVAVGKFSAKIPTTKEVADLVAKGAKVEAAAQIVANPEL